MDCGYPRFGEQGVCDIIQKMLDDAFLFAVVVEFYLRLSFAFTVYSERSYVRS